jgi:hypothetical protein
MDQVSDDAVLRIATAKTISEGQPRQARCISAGAEHLGSRRMRFEKNQANHFSPSE